MPQAPRGGSLHVRRAGLADVGSSDDRSRLRPPPRSYEEVRIKLQQDRAWKMGDAHPALAGREPRRPRLLRQRRRRCCPAKRAYTFGDARLNIVGVGLRNATGSFSLHAQGESDARTRSHSESWREKEFARNVFGMPGVFAQLFDFRFTL